MTEIQPITILTPTPINETNEIEIKRKMKEQEEKNKKTLERLDQLEKVKNKSNKKSIKIKKQQVVGKQNYINQETGEIIETVVVQKNVEQDFNFHKVWIIDLMSIIGEMGNKKIKIIEYILDNINKDNIIYFTYTKLGKELKVSKPTIIDTIKSLIEKNFMKKLQIGVYQVNPDLVVKGSTGKRINLLIQYNKNDNEEKED